jgi:hypothetical protein
VETNSLIDMFTASTPFVIAHGPPGSGKSALLNAVRGEVSNTRFFSVQCDLSAGSIQQLIQRLERAFSGSWSSDEPRGDLAGLKGKIDALHQHLVTQGKRAAAILDDCDWLVRVAVDAPRGEDRQLARALLGFLVEEASTRRLGVVLVATTGFLLRRGEIDEWHNPIARQARWIELQPLALLDLQTMLRDLGAQINVSFDVAAVESLHRVSGGNIHVVRALCRSIVVPMRRKTNLSPLHQLQVTKPDIVRAANELAAMPDTFSDRMTSCLTSLERRVLRVVAELRPRRIGQLTVALGDKDTHDDCREALERLHRIGFIEWHDGRAQVSIPVFRDWIKNHIELSKAHRQMTEWRRLRSFTIGVASSTLLLGAYYVWTKEQTVTWSSTECSYLLASPKRAIPGERVPLQVVRSCKQDESVDTIFLKQGEATSAVFASETAANTVGKYRLGGGRSDWQNDQIFVTFGDVAHDEFAVKILGGRSDPIVIKKDWLGRFSAFAHSVLAFAGALPALLGAMLAFQRDVFSALRRFTSGPASSRRTPQSP